jgi:hypothetical protein
MVVVQLAGSIVDDMLERRVPDQLLDTFNWITKPQLGDLSLEAVVLVDQVPHQRYVFTVPLSRDWQRINIFQKCFLFIEGGLDAICDLLSVSLSSESRVYASLVVTAGV